MTMTTAATATTNQENFQTHLALAEEGDVEAQYWTAKCYDDWGTGVEKHKGKAFGWYECAAHSNSGKAKFMLGWRLDDRHQKKEAQRLWAESIPFLLEEATEGNDDESMHLLAMAYQFGGKGVPKDVSQSTVWLQKAADRGNPTSQFWIAGRHEHGLLGFEQNLERALCWTFKAAKNGNESAQYQLGNHFRYGEGGVEQRDLIQALHWYQQAKDNGDEDAESNLSDLKKEISVTQARLEAHAVASLNSNSNNNNNKPFPLSLWSFGLAKLATREHQPAGFSPTFFVLKELAPFVFKTKKRCLLPTYQT